MMIDSDKLIRILENLKESTTGKEAVLKEPAVYSRIIEIVKHMEKGVEPVTEYDRDYPWYHCPICRTPIMEHHDRCNGCGTKIDWD